MYTVISIILLVLLLLYAWYRVSRKELEVPEQVDPKDLVNGPVDATENPNNGLDVVEELKYPHEEISVPKITEPPAAEKPRKSAAARAKKAPKKAKD